MRQTLLLTSCSPIAVLGHSASQYQQLMLKLRNDADKPRYNVNLNQKAAIKLSPFVLALLRHAVRSEYYQLSSQMLFATEKHLQYFSLASGVGFAAKLTEAAQ